MAWFTEVIGALGGSKGISEILGTWLGKKAPSDEQKPMNFNPTYVIVGFGLILVVAFWSKIKRVFT